MATLDRINESLKRVSGPAKELLLIIKKEIEDVAEAFAVGITPGTKGDKRRCRCGCVVSADEIPCDAEHCACKKA